MSKYYRIYLDVCCLNRPFDDQTQLRIHLETEAVMIILNQCQLKNWKLITSDALDAELSLNSKKWVFQAMTRLILLVRSSRYIFND